MDSSRSRRRKRSKGKTKNSYSPNDPRMRKLIMSVRDKPRVIPSHHLYTGFSNPSVTILRKGGTRKHKYGGYVSAPLRKTSKNRSRRNNSRVGGYVYGGNLGLHHFYP